MVANIRERLLVSKQAASTFDAERLYVKHLSVLEVRKKNKIKIPDRFEALANLSNDKDINSAC
jgi:hypothetical protein